MSAQLGRFLVAFAGALLAAFGFVLNPAAAAATTVDQGLAYVYDDQDHPVVTTRASTERGPPEAYEHGATYNTADVGSRGALAHPDTAVSLAPYAYDRRSQLEQVASVGAATERRTGAAAGHMSPLTPSAVAAKTKLPRVRDERGSVGPFSNRTTPLTNAQAADMARRVGYTPTKFIMRGQKVFTNGKNYIVQDTTSHSGGLWKMARTVDGLNSKKTRMGTYDYNLERIGP